MSHGLPGPLLRAYQDMRRAMARFERVLGHYQDTKGDPSPEVDEVARERIAARAASRVDQMRKRAARRREESR